MVVPRLIHPAEVDLALGAGAALARPEHLAAHRARRPTRVAIVGGGIAGMSAAAELLACGVTHISIYVDRPIETLASWVAAGLVEPIAGARDAGGIAREKALFRLAMRMWTAFHRAQGTWLVSRRQVRSVSCSPREMPEWSEDVFGARQLDRDELPVRCREGWGMTFGTYVVETKPYLLTLRSRLQAAGVRFVRRHVDDLGELREVDAIVNASGLGAARLAADPAMFRGDGHVIYVRPVAGVDEVFMEEQRAPEVSEADPYGINMLYVIPRLTDIVIGGTLHLSDDVSGAPEREPGLPEHLMRLAAGVDGRLADAEVIDYRAAARPCRHGGVRVELDCSGQVPVVHCFGQGGSGWTVAPALAESAVGMLADRAWARSA